VQDTKALVLRVVALQDGTTLFWATLAVARGIAPPPPNSAAGLRPGGGGVLRMSSHEQKRGAKERVRGAAIIS
jgi:hypothetical protein